MKMKTIIKDQNGTSAVEFAIILPLLIFVIFGIIEFSLLLYNKQVITNAAREGARAGIIVRPTRVSDEEIKVEIKNYAQQYLITFGSDTLEDDDIIIPVRGLTFGSPLRVDVTYDYEFLVLNNPITQIWGGIGPIELTTSSTMRME